MTERPEFRFWKSTGSKKTTPSKYAENTVFFPRFTNSPIGGGCFFCPNAKEKELRHLYDHHRDLWDRLLALQKVPNKATELFNRDFRFDEIDAMFKMDDAQMSIFDFLDEEGGTE